MDQEAFSCSICLDILIDPVTIPCGHSYCMNCIKAHWDGERKKKLCSCPQCRKTFRPRPVLEKNVIIAALIEGMKKVGLQAAPADHCYAGPEDVACDVCTGRKLKAIKSCLVCGAAYCQNHIQPHYNAPPLKKHKLIYPSKTVQEEIHSRHDEVMKILTNEYQSAAAAERAEKQKELEVSRQQIQQRIQDGEKDVKLLQQEVEAINVSADKAVEDSEKIFTQLIRVIQKRSSYVKQKIRSQQETEVSRVKELQEKLEQEITELKRKDGELEQLSHTEDHTQFLHNYPSLSALSESTHSSRIKICPVTYFEEMTAAVLKLMDILQDILKATLDTLIPDYIDLSEFMQLAEPEPTSRADFLKYAKRITLDPNTANYNLLLSEENRKVTFTDQRQFYPASPERFTAHSQVMSRERLTGRRYWEVEWRGNGVSLGLTYKSIRRIEAKDAGLFGFNNKSWALYFDPSSCCLWHRRRVTDVTRPRSSRVGVYLDHMAGTLSFYSVSDTMTLLHRVQTTFTQPLYAGLWLFNSAGDSAEFIKLK